MPTVRKPKADPESKLVTFFNFHIVKVLILCRVNDMFYSCSSRCSLFATFTATS